jgi:hypothetical protein
MVSPPPHPYVNPRLHTSGERQAQHPQLRAFRFVPLLLVLVILSAAQHTNAQDTVTGAFEGTISDSQTGAALKGAQVEIINQQTGVTASLRTDFRGRFYQGLLLPGTYRIRVSYPNYETKEVVQALKITYTGEVVPVPVALDPTPPAGVAPPAAAPTPPLTAEDTEIPASINRFDGRRSGSFSDKEVTTLPLGGITIARSFDELALLLPGVAPPPQTLGTVAGPGVGAGVGSAGQFSVNGLRSRGNNFTVDGSDNNDEDIGVRRQGFVALIPQPTESVQEYQVITLLAPAQFGRNIGAQVNAVSRSGGNQIHGSVYGRFNSSQLNARNFFDTTFGNATSTVRANNQNVLIQTRDANGVVLSQQPLTVRNESGGEDSFTFGQTGFVIGGPIKSDRAFYFASFESSITNATEENSFAVPTLEQRGAFRTGATGIFQDPLTGAATSAIPATRNGSGIFSLYPFPNNPDGVYGANTFTQVLPANGRGVIFSGKIDDNFNVWQRPHSFTARYNFTNDWREIPVTGGAIFSTLRPRIRTQNLSLFLNSQVSGPNSRRSKFNQVRLSYGRTRLNFEEVRDNRFQISSFFLPDTPFLLNAPQLINATTPSQPGAPNTGPVIYVRSPFSVEQELSPLGQVNLGGFSPLGVDVFNFPQRRVNNTYQVADEFTWALSSHRLTFGADIRRSELNSDLPRNARPLVTFNGSPRLILENGALRFPTANDINPIIRAEDLAAMGAASNFFQTLNTTSNDASISLRYYQLNFYAQDVWRPTANLALSYGLRYEYNTSPRELNNRIEDTFGSPILNFAPALRQFIDGRSQIFDSDRNNFAPRVGAAYSKEWFGRHLLSVFRGGYGIFYDQILGAVVSQSRNVFPTFLTLNFGGGPSFGQFPLVFDNPSRQSIGVVGVGFVPLVIPNTINRYNPQIPLSSFFNLINTTFPSALGATLPQRELETPKAHHYTFSFEQQLRRNLMLAAAYTGTRGQNLLRFTSPNLGPGLSLALTSFGVDRREFAIPVVFGQVNSPARPIAGIGAINQFETTARSKYDSLQLQLRGQSLKSLQYQVSYTFSKTTDDVSDVFDLAGAYVLPQNSLNLVAEYGPANFDVRHQLSYHFIFDIPRFKEGPAVLQNVLNGFTIAGIGRFLSAQPFTVNSTIDVNLDGNPTDRLNTTQGLTVTGNGQQPLLLTTTNTLSLLAPFGQDGAIGRNIFRAANIISVDVSASRRWSFGGTKSLMFRAEIFNLPNRANFGIPVRLLEAPGFGKAVNTVTPGRRLQLALQYSF